jgi:hypothetical protein
MPDILTLCKDLEGIQLRLTELGARVDSLTKMVQTGQYSGNSGQAAPSSTSPIGSAPPMTQPPAPQAQAKPDTKSPQIGDLPGYMPDVFEGHQRGATARKRSEFGEASDGDEFAFIKKCIEDIQAEKNKAAYDIDYIEMSGPAKPSKKNGNKVENPMDRMDELVEKLIDKRLKEEAQGEKFMKAILDKVRAEGRSEIKDEVEKSEMRVLTNVFGRRIANMLTPGDLHAGQWLSMAQTAKFMDQSARNAVRNSNNLKAANGLITKAEAEEGGGAFATLAGAGGQALGGALIGIYIAEHIPDIVNMLRDSVEFIDSIRALIAGGHVVSGATKALDQASSFVGSIAPAIGDAQEYAASRNFFGDRVTPKEEFDFWSKSSQVRENDARLQRSLKRFFEQEANANIAEAYKASSMWDLMKHMFTAGAL